MIEKWLLLYKVQENDELLLQGKGRMQLSTSLGAAWCPQKIDDKNLAQISNFAPLVDSE